MFLDSGGSTWYRAFLEGTTTGWEASWTSQGGALVTIAPAGSSGANLYVVGQDISNALWWNQANPSQWTRVRERHDDVAAGPR